MKVFLKKDIERFGMAGEMINVAEGYARNFLIPRGLAVEINPTNEDLYAGEVKRVEDRKKVIESKTSMLAERIGKMKLKIKKKMHDDGKLYGAVSPQDVVTALSEHGVSVSKNQVVFDKSIKAKGSYDVTIKLTSRLKPHVSITIISE